MEPAHSHRASKWQNQDSKPDLLDFKVRACCTPLSRCVPGPSLSWTVLYHKVAMSRVLRIS